MTGQQGKSGPQVGGASRCLHPWEESLAVIGSSRPYHILALTRFYRDQNPEIKREINVLWPEGAPDSSRTREDKLLWPEGVPDECNWIVQCSMRKSLKDERPDMAKCPRVFGRL